MVGQVGGGGTVVVGNQEKKVLIGMYVRNSSLNTNYNQICSRSKALKSCLAS